MADTKFKKGVPRAAGAGRKKGTPNKKKLLSVEEILNELDVNPIRELIRIAKETGEEAIEVQCYKEVAKYSYSQKKAVESNSAIEIAKDIAGDIVVKIVEDNG